MPEALEQLTQEEEQKLSTWTAWRGPPSQRVEQSGIIFVDEIDKIAGREGGHGPDVSREGVQRDILPIVEGTTVNTKYGMVQTDHILFIAAGAFHVSKPSDLIPELQGRFPIRVELEALGRDDFVRILTEPRSALVKQYMALLGTEGVDARVHARRDRADRRLRALVNERTENIGARRLHTVMEKLLDEISFDAPELRRHRPSPSTRPTSTACSPTSSRTRTFRGTSCDAPFPRPSPARSTSRRCRSLSARRSRVAMTRRLRQKGTAARAAAPVARPRSTISSRCDAATT